MDFKVGSIRANPIDYERMVASIGLNQVFLDCNGYKSPRAPTVGSLNMY